VAVQRNRLRTDRTRFFAVESGYLIVLAIVFVVYQVSAGVRGALPTHLGDLPVGVPWFGAVGGTLISLTGVFKHSRDWDEHFALWHYARPLVGAFLGSLGALMFLVIVDAAAVHGTTPNGVVYEVVAFLVGYREATFRSLLQRATDVLLSPGEKKSPPDRPHDLQGGSPADADRGHG
jgi:hypothetical protein